MNVGRVTRRTSAERRAAARAAALLGTADPPPTGMAPELTIGPFATLLGRDADGEVHAAQGREPREDDHADPREEVELRLRAVLAAREPDEGRGEPHEQEQDEAV